MKWLEWWKAWFRTVAKSVSNVAFYREVRLKRLSEAAGYMAVLLALSWMLPFAVSFFLQVRTGLEAFNRGLRTHVPAGTAFEMKNGKLTTSLAEPIVVRSGKSVFIVNTSDSALAPAADEVGLAVGSESIIQKSAPDRTEITSFASFPDFKTTKEGIDAWLEGNARWLVLLTALVVFSVLAILLAAGTGLMVAFHAAVFWMLLRLLKKHWHYKEVYVVALYAATLPVVSRAILTFADVDAGFIPSALYWVLLAFILYDVYRGGEANVQGQKAAADRPGQDDRGAA